MRRSHVNDSKLLQERTAKMRASSEELRDNHSAGVIRRLAEVSDRHADRAGSRRRRSATKRCVSGDAWIAKGFIRCADAERPP
jgi:hypothetical protein